MTPSSARRISSPTRSEGRPEARIATWNPPQAHCVEWRKRVPHGSLPPCGGGNDVARLVVTSALRSRARLVAISARHLAEGSALLIIAIGPSLLILRRKHGPAQTDSLNVPSQRGDHRPCRPWQDHPGRPSVATVGRFPGKPA